MNEKLNELKISYENAKNVGICLFLECKFDKEIVMGFSKVPNGKKCSFWSKDNRTPINSFL